jgi:hypothetical protein
VISKLTKQFLGIKTSTLWINLDNSVFWVLLVASVSVSVAFFALTVLVALIVLDVQTVSDALIALIAVTVVVVIAVVVVEVDTAAEVDNTTFQLKPMVA